MSRQASWVLGLGSEEQAVSCSSWALTEGLVLLQATVLFFHPFPQVLEHCIRQQASKTFSRDRKNVQTRLDSPGLRACTPQHRVQLPPLLSPTQLPLPRAQCSKQGGSFLSCRLGGWRVRAVDTGRLRRALLGSVTSSCTAQACSECHHHRSGCTCSSFPQTSW